MNLLYARMKMPRRWVEITTSAHDRQALLAGVAALHALSYAASSSIRHWVLSARRAGATWQEIAAAIDFGTGEDYRRHFIDNEVKGYDWPLPLDGPGARTAPGGRCRRGHRLNRLADLPLIVQSRLVPLCLRGPRSRGPATRSARSSR